MANKTRYRAQWGADTVEIRAKFDDPTCPVEGTNGRQVADFAHHPGRAMRYAIELEARAEGFDIEDPDTIEKIEESLASMEAFED